MNKKLKKTSLHIGFFLSYYGGIFLNFIQFNKKIRYFSYMEQIQILQKNNGNKTKIYLNNGKMV